MDDLISRQAAIDALGGNEPVGDPSKMDDDDVVKMWERIRIINIINKLPSTQPTVEPRAKGHWIKSDSPGRILPYECSECGNATTWHYNFCDECGADMRGVTE